MKIIKFKYYLCLSILILNILLLCACAENGTGSHAAPQGKTVNENNDDDEAESRCELVYGCLYLSSDISERITKFNEENEDYYITVRKYGDTLGKEEANVQLQLEMTSGRAPDIIDMSVVSDYLPYARQGYLEDLRPYLQAQQDGLYMNVLECYAVDSGIYMLIPHFGIEGLTISADLQEEIDEWNIDCFFRLIEAHADEKNIFTSTSEEYILRMGVGGMQNRFIDYDSGTVDFENETFYKLLEFSKKYGRQRAGDGASTIAEVAQQTIFMNFSYQNPASYIAYEEYFGSGFNVFGYPTDGEQEYIIKPTIDACAIYSKSRNKQGAWQFLDSLLDEAYQVNKIAMINYWPVCRASMNEMIEEVQAMSDNGTGKVNDTVMNFSDEKVQILMNIIEDGKLIGDFTNGTIMEIVLEEAQAYFNDQKSCEEVAAVIQGRLQLYIDEMY